MSRDRKADVDQAAGGSGSRGRRRRPRGDLGPGEQVSGPTGDHGLAVERSVGLSVAAAAAAADALLTRVRWYVARGRAVPRATAAAFDELADALGLPDAAPWTRLHRPAARDPRVEAEIDAMADSGELAESARLLAESCGESWAELGDEARDAWCGRVIAAVRARSPESPAQLRLRLAPRGRQSPGDRER